MILVEQVKKKYAYVSFVYYLKLIRIIVLLDFESLEHPLLKDTLHKYWLSLNYCIENKIP